jgi:hypothetical protein
MFVIRRLAFTQDRLQLLIRPALRREPAIDVLRRQPDHHAVMASEIEQLLEGSIEDGLEESDDFARVVPLRTRCRAAVLECQLGLTQPAFPAASYVLTITLWVAPAAGDCGSTSRSRFL